MNGGNLTRVAFTLLALLAAPALGQFCNRPNELFGRTGRIMAGLNPAAVATADLDNDGKNDVVLANNGSDDIHVAYNNGDGTFSTVLRYPVGSAPRGVAIADVNVDGILDIVTANGGSDDISILVGNGSRSFAPQQTYPSGDGTVDVAGGDIDGDGDIDLVTANTLDNDITVFLNDGNSAFLQEVRIGVGIRPQRLLVTDVSGDGSVDIVTINQSSDDVSVLLNDGTGNFPGQSQYATGRGPVGLGTGDLDADGDLDLVVTNSFDDTVSVLHNDGNGAYSSQPTLLAGERPVFAATGDIDSDGNLDIVIANAGNFITGANEGVSIFLGTADDTYLPEVRYTAGQSPFALAVTDLNDDGSLDVVTADSVSGTGSVIFNDGMGEFAATDRYRTGDGPGSLATGDIDADGLVDILTVNPDLDAISVLRGDGNGVFGDPTHWQVGTFPFDIAAGDFNSDMLDDVAVVNLGSDDNGNGTTSILLGSGNGTLAPAISIPAGPRPDSLAMADIDDDGHAEILVANLGGDSIDIIDRDVNGDFVTLNTYSVGDEPRVVSGDLDGDGKIDVVTVNQLSDDISVLRNLGDGSLGPETRHPVGDGPTTIVLGDADGDGDLDIAVGNRAFGSTQGSDISLLLNDGSAGLDEQPRIRGGSVETLSDIDRDGDADLVLIEDGGMRILFNEGDGTFVDELSFSVGDGPADALAYDFDQDGHVDIAVTNRGSDDVSVRLNKGLDVAIWTSGTDFSLGSSWSIGIPPSVDAPDVALFDSTSADAPADPVVDVALTEATTVGAIAQANGLVTLDLAGFPLDIVGTRSGRTLEALETGIPQCGGDRTFPHTAPVFRFEDSSGSISTITTPEAVIGVPGDATLELADNVQLEVLGDVLNRGVLAFDRHSDTAAPSVATIAEAYRQLDGRLTVDLGSTGESPPLGRVQVAGQAILRGSLAVEADEAFDPAIGDRFTLLTAGEPIGQARFGAAFLPGLPAGKFFTVEYNTSLAAPGSLVLEVRSLGENLGFGGSNQLSVSGLPVAAELADLNADGLPDIVLAVPDEVNPLADAGSVIVLINAGVNSAGVWQGFASTQDIQVGVDPSDVALGDLDGDSFADAIITNRGDGNATILLNDGTGVLAFDRVIAFNEGPTAVVVGDLDEDGLIDVAVAGSTAGGGGELLVRLNLGPNGGGGWSGLSSPLSFVIGQEPTFMDIGDLDNDTCLDLMIGSVGDGGINLLDNRGGGQGPTNWQGFAPSLVITTGSDPVFGDIGDLDNDTCLDLLIVDFNDGTISIISHNAPPGVFGFSPPASIPVGLAPRSIVSADFDGDLDGDIAVVTDRDDGTGRVVRLLRNDVDLGDPIDPADDGQLQFAPAADLDVNGDPVLVLAGDVDGTGSQDVVAITEATAGGTPRPDGSGGGPSSLVSTQLNLEDAVLGCNAADVAAPSGTLNIDDVLAFVSAFATGDLVIGDIDSSGSLDIDDVLAFLSDFAGGCP